MEILIILPFPYINGYFNTYTMFIEIEIWIPNYMYSRVSVIPVFAPIWYIALWCI